MQHEFAAQQRAAVVREADPERLREPSRPARDRAQWRVLGESAQRAHPLDAFAGLERAQQHRRATAASLANHVRAGVHAVARIHVEAPGRAEHRTVARRRPAVRVRGRVASVPDVSLDLDDPPGEPGAVAEAVHEERAEQIAGHLRAGSIEERARQGRAEPHGKFPRRYGPRGRPAMGRHPIQRYHSGSASR
jgi:hypothetical protein